MEVVLRPYEACGALAIGAENLVCAKMVIFVNQECVSLEGGTIKLICAKNSDKHVRGVLLWRRHALY